MGNTPSEGSAQSAQQDASLRKSMDRLIEGTFDGGPQGGDRREDGFAVDILERADCFVVRAALPGVAPDDLHVTLQGDLLTIRGKTAEASERHGDRWVVREHRSGEIQRTMRLPSPVDATGAAARFEHGMLMLELPKSQAAAGEAKTGAAAGRAGEHGLVNPTAVDPTKPKVEGGQPPTSSAGMGPDEENRDLVSDESEASFPASDPPSWTPEHA